MADYNAVADNVRAFISSIDQTHTSAVVDLAAAYARLCQECNDRLRRCADYLRRGMRSEAIHLADMLPPLLDVVATLDLPELEDWENLCATYDLTKPPKLLLETAQALNEAYAAEQPIQNLLGRHRLLALVQAPLADRIAVMRDLAAQDVENPYWDDDLRTFERARLTTLRAEASAAVKSRDGGRVASLLAEVEQQEWRSEVPPDVPAALRRAARELQRDEANARLKMMLPDLETAYNAMDAPACEQLLDAWDQIGMHEAAPLDPHLAEQVRPVREWLAEEKARDALAARVRADNAALLQALDADAPTEDLISLRRAAELHGVPLGAELRQRFDLLIEHRELTRRRRVRRNAAVITLTMLLGAAGVGVMIQRNITTRQARQWASQVEDHVSAGRLAEGSAAWDNLLAQAPQLKDRRELVEAKRDVDNAIAAEAKRRDDFRSAMDRATAKGASNPDAAALAEADKLASTNGEKLEILNFREQVEGQKFARQEKIDAAFRQRISTLAENLGAMEQQLLNGGQLDGLSSKIDAADTDVMGIGQMSGVTLAARQGLVPLTQRLASIRTRYKEVAAESAALEQVMTASPQDLADALKSFAKKFPDSSHSTEFNLAAEDATDWQSILDWSSVASRWGYRFVPGSASDLAKKQKEIEDYLKGHANSPVSASLARSQDYLKRAAVAMSTDGPWKSSLRATMNSPLVRDLNVIAAGGKNYYVVKDGELSKRVLDVGGQQFTKGVAIKAVLTNDIEKPAPKIIDVPSDAKAVPSPQAKLSADVLRMVDSYDYANWEMFGPMVLQRLRADPEMDPILGVILATRIVRFTQAAGWGMDDRLGEALEHLEALNADDILWMNPEDTAAIQVRPRAKEVIAGLPKTPELRQMVDTQRAAIFGPLGVRVSSTAVMFKESGAQRVRTEAKPQSGSEIYALMKGVDAAGSATKVLNRVGSVKNGQWALEPAAKSIPEGSLLFIRQPASSPR